VQSWKSWNDEAGRALAERRLVPIGRVLHAHGTAGEVVVSPFLTDLTYYRRLQHVALRRSDQAPHRYRVRQARLAGERILLQLEGCASVEAAQALIGCDVCVPRHELPPPGEGEFYWFDLEGLAVVTEDGAYLGRVADFFPTGSNEVLVVRDGRREVLLPFIKDVILAVDAPQGRLWVRIVPGLL
jgi:16S rRNA processing protein RimM